jgi:hypothetical protein
MIDLAEMMHNWQKSDCPAECEQADVDTNGIVDLSDLLILSTHWLEK